jgi:hypothetical protein
MQKKSVSRILMVATPVMIVYGLFASCETARAQSEDGACSNRTLKGDYGFKIDGQLLAGPLTGLVRGLAMTSFDGQGNMSQVDFVTLNGTPLFKDWRPSGKGTYKINANCTGMATIIYTDGSPSTELRLVVVRSGKEIHTVVVGNAVGSIGIKVD